ncbi:heme exporter protein CcmD [Candidatus Legionella polyplacis]|uniref:heme exporter protein CcmD n=1 Tax=Candidatus Legionella polyplacis TaxID=2005262 RepID=UPI003BB061AD
MRKIFIVLSMGDYTFYIWISYITVVIVLLINFFILKIRYLRLKSKVYKFYLKRIKDE